MKKKVVVVADGENVVVGYDGYEKCSVHNSQLNELSMKKGV